MKEKQTIYIQAYHSPYGDLLLGATEDKLCLCDWSKGTPRTIVNQRFQRLMKADYKENYSKILSKARKQLEEYFTKQRTAFEIPLLFIGTEFQKKVWSNLLKIPYGQTISYKKLAQQMDCPYAIRAVANANSANALSIFIPCHRVIGSNRICWRINRQATTSKSRKRKHPNSITHLDLTLLKSYLLRLKVLPFEGKYR